MPHRILVLDDTPSELEWLQNVLQKQGFEVGSFASGEMLIETVEGNSTDQFDAVLLDIILCHPNSNMELDKQGRDYCMEIKTIKPYIPVFAVTSDNDPQRIADTMLKFGFDGFVAKSELRADETYYSNHIRSGIKYIGSYPQFKTGWHNIAKLADYQWAVKAQRLNKLREHLKKAYFYLLVSDANPLLNLLLPRANNSFGEAILQCAIALENVLNYEHKEKNRKYPSIVKHAKRPGVERYEKAKSLVRKGLLRPQDQQTLDEIFKMRRKCAHPSGRRFDRRAGLNVMVETTEILLYYLERKKQQVFG